MKDAFNQIRDAYTEDNETLVINTCPETGVDPMEMMSWWKAVDPGEFKMGSEDYWESAPSKAMSKRGPRRRNRDIRQRPHARGHALAGLGQG